MVDWPASLPQTPLQDGYSEELQNVIISSQPDIGPAKLRKRTSAGVKKYNLSFLMSSTQYNTFITFFEGDANYGATKFNFDDPISGTSSEFRFDIQAGPPSVTPLSGGQYRVTFPAEKLP